MANLVMRYFQLGLVLLLAAPAQAQQAGQMLEVSQQLTRLEAEIRQLRGEIERLSYENKRLKNQQNDLYVDLDQRLRSMETGLPIANRPPAVETVVPASRPSLPQVQTNPPAVTGLVPSLKPVGPAVVAGPSSVAPASTASAASVAPVNPARERAAYKDAFNLLKAGKYDEAILTYSEFLRRYPNGQYAANAQYWLGEANYVTRQFPAAIDEFNKVIVGYPQSRKLSDAMLKIGYIHYELKQSDKARRVLTELMQKYPGTTAARLAANRLQRMKLEGR